MKVRELIELSPFCDTVEVIVRESGCGKWIQGYRISKNAKLFPANLTAEIIDKYSLESWHQTVHLKRGEEVDTVHGARALPMKVICKDVRRIPDYIGNLTIHSIQPRHIPSYHKEALTHNDFDYDINVYPEDFVPEVEKTKQEEPMTGQMSIEEFL